MGVTTGAPAWHRWMRPLAWASLVANVVIVVTGGAVRLTGVRARLPDLAALHGRVVHPARRARLHSAIEFGNRMLTFVLAAVAVATFVAAWQTGTPRRCDPGRCVARRWGSRPRR